mgnify:CR=1 FL=1
MSISDYKGALELLSNGIQVPYLGIEGQEVTSEMEKNGMTSWYLYIRELPKP